MLRAAILVLLERPHPDKQEAIALSYAAAHQLQLVSLCHRLDDVVALLLAGTIRAVVAVVDPGPAARRTIETLGGALHVVREHESRLRREVSTLIARMAAEGLDPKKIAGILDVDTGDVRDALERANMRRPQ